MSESVDNKKFIIKWTVFLFLISLGITCFSGNRNYYCIGLSIGTIGSILKFIYNHYYFDKLLKTGNTKNNFLSALVNVFVTIFLIGLICLGLQALNMINIYSVIGLFIGFSFIPIVIIIAGILQSKYIIRNKI